MDYKKIITNKQTRLKILKMLDFVPDRLMIKLQYWISTGRYLNLKDPKRFTEKLQWYKLYYRDPLMIQCSDKFHVRSYVESKGLENILVPLYGVYERAIDIKFDKLPSKFVLKTTNGSHTNILCKNKEFLDIEQSKNKLDEWLDAWEGKVGREWAYHRVGPRIICEKYLDTDKNDDLVDYKFFCFNGEPLYLYVITERFLNGGAKLGVFDLDFNQLSYKRIDIPKLSNKIERPSNFDEMIEIARILAKNFPHVRVDLYNIDGKIYFGELTFYNGSGYKGYEPDEFDFIVGEKFILPLKYKE